MNEHKRRRNLLDFKSHHVMDCEDLATRYPTHLPPLPLELLFLVLDHELPLRGLLLQPLAVRLQRLHLRQLNRGQTRLPPVLRHERHLGGGGGGGRGGAG